jgi:hypothetical protein
LEVLNRNFLFGLENGTIARAARPGAILESGFPISGPFLRGTIRPPGARVNLESPWPRWAGDAQGEQDLCGSICEAVDL